MNTSETYLICHDGLHIGNAYRLVRVASAFESDVTVHYDGYCANAKSLIRVLNLGVLRGEEIRLTATGPDAGRAIETLDVLAQTYGRSQWLGDSPSSDKSCSETAVAL